jgi:hypothetical protein
MLHNVCAPLCRLLPSVSDVRVERERRRGVSGFGVAPQRLYGFQEYVSAYRRGVRPLRFVPHQPDAGLITITLREASHWPARNSDVAAWIAAAKTLRDELGARVVFVRDTAKASEPVPDFETDVAAALDIDARAELYARAALNLGVSNGPIWMCLAMDAPTIVFRPVDDAVGLAFSTRHLRYCGVPEGGQLPGAPAWHRLVWERETAAAIVQAASDYFDQVGAAA